MVLLCFLRKDVFIYLIFCPDSHLLPTLIRTQTSCEVSLLLLEELFLESTRLLSRSADI